MNDDVTRRRFEAPDETRTFDKGRFEIVTLEGVTVGRATYEPGWRWSTHVGGSATARCPIEDVGLVVSGVIELRQGELFHVPALPHDSWVVGDETYVSLHFLGAGQYAR